MQEQSVSSSSSAFPSMASKLQRYKFVWRILMVTNLALGGYIFVTKKKNRSLKSEKHEEAPPPTGSNALTVNSLDQPEIAPATPITGLVISTDTSAPTANFMEEIEIAPSTPVPEPVNPADTYGPTLYSMEESEIIPVTPIAELVKVHEPIADDQQRELFKWILDEKRKVKPRDRNEKKQIDEEKAILKQFIKTKSIPSL